MIFPIIRSVLNGTQEGRIFSCEGNELILHKSGFAYIVINNKNLDGLVETLASLRDRNIYLYNANENLINRVAADSRFSVRVRNRFRFMMGDTKPKLPGAGYCLVNFQAEHLPLLKILGIKSNHFWRNENHFISSSSAILLIDSDSNPISICYAASVYHNIAEIDIVTNPSFRERGFGKIVSSAFIAKSRFNGIVPVWDCFEDNVASLKIAEAFSIEKLAVYKFLSFYSS